MMWKVTDACDIRRFCELGFCGRTMLRINCKCIVALDKIWQIQRLVYNGNRAVMLKMGSATELGPKYPELLTTECNARTAIEEPNSTGQSSTRLAWFWSTARAGELAQPESDHYNECESSIFGDISHVNFNSFLCSLATC